MTLDYPRYCDRCTKELADPADPPSDWEPVVDESGQLVGIRCPGCLTGGEVDAIIEDDAETARQAQELANRELPRKDPLMEQRGELLEIVVELRDDLRQIQEALDPQHLVTYFAEDEARRPRSMESGRTCRAPRDSSTNSAAASRRWTTDGT